MTRLPKRRWQTPQIGIVSARIVMGAYCKLGPPREEACVINSPWNSVGKKQFPIALHKTRKIIKTTLNHWNDDRNNRNNHRALGKSNKREKKTTKLVGHCRRRQNTCLTDTREMQFSSYRCYWTGNSSFYFSFLDTPLIFLLFFKNTTPQFSPLS